MNRIFPMNRHLMRFWNGWLPADTSAVITMSLTMAAEKAGYASSWQLPADAGQPELTCQRNCWQLQKATASSSGRRILSGFRNVWLSILRSRTKIPFSSTRLRKWYYAVCSDRSGSFEGELSRNPLPSGYHFSYNPSHETKVLRAHRVRKLLSHRARKWTALSKELYGLMFSRGYPEGFCDAVTWRPPR